MTRYCVRYVDALTVDKGFTFVKVASCELLPFEGVKSGCRPTLGHVSYTRPLNEKYVERSDKGEEGGGSQE